MSTRRERERERELIGRYICIFICMNGTSDQMVIDALMYMYRQMIINEYTMIILFNLVIVIDIICIYQI